MSLRNRIIRLAHERADLRAHLLPIIKKADDKRDILWAADAIEAGDGEDAVDVLDARIRGRESLADVYGEVSKVVSGLRSGHLSPRRAALMLRSFARTL